MEDERQTLTALAQKMAGNACRLRLAEFGRGDAEDDAARHGMVIIEAQMRNRESGLYEWSMVAQVKPDDLFDEVGNYFTNDL